MLKISKSKELHFHFHLHLFRYGAAPSYKLDNFDFEPDAFEDGKRYKRSKWKFANKSIQTDYRESEAQTDPYSPPYFLPYPGILIMYFMFKIFLMILIFLYYSL